MENSAHKSFRDVYSVQNEEKDECMEAEDIKLIGRSRFREHLLIMYR